MVLLSIEKDQSNIKHKTERCYFIKIEPKPPVSALCLHACTLSCPPDQLSMICV